VAFRVDLIWLVLHVVVKTLCRQQVILLRVSKNVLEGFKTLQRRRGDLFKIDLSKAPKNSLLGSFPVNMRQRSATGHVTGVPRS